MNITVGFFLRLAALAGVFCLAVTVLAQSVGQSTARAQQVVFAASQTGQSGLALLDVDRRLFVHFRLPIRIRSIGDWDWSPDGRQVVFGATRNVYLDLFAMDADGGNLRQVTLNGRGNRSPAWSPDGQSIAFTSDRDGNREIYIMEAECIRQPEGCRQPRRLTFNPAPDDAPSWSPDGRQIAFHSRRDGDYEIYLLEVETKQERRLTTSPGRDTDPAWSPDGRSIAFISERGRNYEIYVMAADGAHPQQLTATEEFEFSPRWSPDGAQILYEAMVAGSDLEAYLMDADGRNRRRLTTISMFLHEPAWRP